MYSWIAQSLNLLISSSSRLIPAFMECLKSRFCWKNRKISPLELQIAIFKNVEWKAFDHFKHNFGLDYVFSSIYFIIYHYILISKLRLDEVLEILSNSLFTIDFSTLILLLDFSANIDPNRVIFNFVDFSWSLLSKYSKFPNFLIEQGEMLQAQVNQTLFEMEQT